MHGGLASGWSIQTYNCAGHNLWMFPMHAQVLQIHLHSPVCSQALAVLLEHQPCQYELSSYYVSFTTIQTFLPNTCIGLPRFDLEKSLHHWDKEPYSHYRDCSSTTICRFSLNCQNTLQKRIFHYHDDPPFQGKQTFFRFWSSKNTIETQNCCNHIEIMWVTWIHMVF